MSEKKLDAQDTVFFENQLESIGRDIEKKYPEKNFNDLMTIDSSDDEGADTISYHMFDEKGAAEFMAAGAADSPNVEVGGKKFSVDVKELGLHMTMTTKEVRNARKGNVSLMQRKANAVVNGVERKHDEIAILGDGTPAYDGLFGIVYNTNTTKQAASAAWSTLSPDEICEEIKAQYVAIQTNTNDVGMADKIALPPTWWTYLKTTERVANYPQTCMEYLEGALDVSIVKHHLLKNAPKNPATLAAGVTDIMLVYNSKAENVSYLEPMPFRFMAPEYKSRITLTESESTSAGVRIVLPLEVVCYYGF